MNLNDPVWKFKQRNRISGDPPITQKFHIINENPQDCGENKKPIADLRKIKIPIADPRIKIL
jgi:hypothetical protein